MNLFNCINAFVSVVNYKGFSAASRHLHVPISALSKQLNMLEQHLEKKLLVRTTRRLELTKEGEIFYVHSKELLSRLKNAEQAIKNPVDDIQGCVTIAIPNCLGPILLFKHFKQILESHPLIKINLVNKPHPELIIDGEIDIAITRMKLNDNQLIRKKLMTLHRAVYAAPAYIKKFGKPNSLQELKNHNCLIHNKLPLIEQWPMLKRVSSIKGNLSSDSYADLIKAAVEGMGLLCVAKILVETEVKRKKLIVLPMPDTTLQTDLYLYYKPILARHPIKIITATLLREFNLV